MNNFNQILLEAIKLALAGIAGGLIGARANDRFARIRDRDAGMANRRREFLVFMKSWRGDLERPRFGSGSEDAAPKIFLDGLLAWHGFVALICDDFTGESRIKFDELVAIVPKCYVHDKNKILKAMNDVIAYVEIRQNKRCDG